jgi:hypothetical protein
MVTNSCERSAILMDHFSRFLMEERDALNRGEPVSWQFRYG